MGEDGRRRGKGDGEEESIASVCLRRGGVGGKVKMKAELHVARFLKKN